MREQASTWDVHMDMTCIGLDRDALQCAETRRGCVRADHSVLCDGARDAILLRALPGHGHPRAGDALAQEPGAAHKSG